MTNLWSNADSLATIDDHPNLGLIDATQIGTLGNCDMLAYSPQEVNSGRWESASV